MAGRPRSTKVDKAIEQATRQLLKQDGWAALSMEAIARQAGIAKTTLYRRYDNLGALVLNVIFESVKIPPLEPSLNWRVQLTQALMILGMGFHLPEIRAATMGMMVWLGNDDALRQHFQQNIMARNAGLIQALIERGQAQGDVSKSANPARIAEMLGGMLFWRAVVMEEPASMEEIQQAIEQAL